MNDKFPGRPDYVGPTVGWFGLPHHDKLLEESHDVMERVAYVKKNKPQREIDIRLHNMIYLDPVLCPAVAQCKSLDDAYRAQRKPLDDAYRAQCKPMDDAYWAQRKPLDNAYRAQRKPLDDAYWAQRKSMEDAYRAQRNPLDDAYWAQRNPLDDAYRAQCKPLEDEILSYIRSEIPDCAWNGKELVFAKKAQT